MATGSVTWTPGSFTMPDGSTSNLAPGIRPVKSSATAPAPWRLHALFDASTDEWCCLNGRVPANFASAPVLKVQYKMASAVTGVVKIEGRVACITPGDTTDADAKAFDTANTTTGTVPATTAGKIAELSLTLTTNDSMAAGDDLIIRFSRLGSDAADTATGDMEVTSVTLEYTTT
jgi:hypothetical protein